MPVAVLDALAYVLLQFPTACSIMASLLRDRLLDAVLCLLCYCLGHERRHCTWSVSEIQQRSAWFAEVLHVQTLELLWPIYGLPYCELHILQSSSAYCGARVLSPLDTASWMRYCRTTCEVAEPA